MTAPLPAIRQCRDGRWQAGYIKPGTVTVWRYGTHRYAWQALRAAKRDCKEIDK